jgi:adenosylhomocysteine nucleosidase
MGDPRTIVLISANSEWRAVKEILAPPQVQSTPPGETFTIRPWTFFHGGWGKISAAATTQYVIDHFQPDLLVNLGTCGGFEGRIERGTVILVTKTIVYDITEQMSDPEEAIAHYSTELDLSWLNDRGSLIPDHSPVSIIRGPLVSADRDILPADIPGLVKKYAAVAADWESGAIAWVAKRNGVRCLILRGVTDLVSPSGGGEAYGNIGLFHENTKTVMKTLIDQLPLWLEGIK